MAEARDVRPEGPPAPPPSGLGGRLLLLVRLRWILVLATFAYALVVVFLLRGGPDPSVLPTPIFLAALPLLVLAQNVYVRAAAARPEAWRAALAASLLGDLLAITAGLHGTGGVASWLWALYPLVTLEAAFLSRDVRVTAATALAGAAAYGVVEVLEATGVLAPIVTSYTAGEQGRPMAYALAKAGWVGVVNVATAIAGIWALEALDRAHRALEDAYARLERQYDELRELDRLKSNFLSVVAHELRTPLTIAGGYAELAEDDPGLTDEGRAHLAATTAAIAGLATSVDLMLAYVEVADAGRPLRREPLGALEVLEQAFESNEAACREAGLVLMHDEPAGDLRIEADPGRLAAALGELVENARRATPPGGTVGLRAWPWHGQVVFEVWDTGPGVPQAVRERLGEAFLQPDAALTEHTPGLGLGLAFACLVAGRHGGTLRIADRPGGGAAGRLAIPAGAASAGQGRADGSGAGGHVVARPG